MLLQKPSLRGRFCLRRLIYIKPKIGFGMKKQLAGPEFLNFGSVNNDLTRGHDERQAAGSTAQG